MNKVEHDIKTKFMPQNSHVKLSEELQGSCEGAITLEELETALQSTKHCKSPGIDGLPYEFYKMFWLKIRDCLLKSINHSYQHEQMSINQTRGVISLLPKGNKDTLYLSNWRPITLLCCDYKIISKCWQID